MVSETQVASDSSNVSPNRLLSALVFVERDIQTEAAVWFEPLIAPGKPLPSPIQILRVILGVEVRVVLDIDVVRRRRDDEIDRRRLNGFRLQNVVVDDL